MNSNSGMIGNRQVGVREPEGQLHPPGMGPANRVLNLARAETYAVRWTDDRGAIHTELMHYVNGNWFRAPNGENYHNTLMKLSADGWLGKQLNEMRATSAPLPDGALPKQDAVDIMGSAK